MIISSNIHTFCRMLELTPIFISEKLVSWIIALYQVKILGVSSMDGGGTATHYNEKPTGTIPRKESVKSSQ